MASTLETHREFRFACTQCGACCNRSPEVMLSEAAALSDVFVFRLSFRIYELSRTLAGYLASEQTADGAAETFYEAKRLLNAFSARKHLVKRKQQGKTTEYSKYLTISALTLDTDTTACNALSGGRCGIYERRPLSCRTVPFHYSRPEASAAKYLGAFVETPGYACDTSAEAPVVLEGGRIVDPEARQARLDALALADRERQWSEAILRRLKGDAHSYGLPTLGEIEANAAFGVTTTSMRVAWQIGVEAGAIEADECRKLIAAQVEAIDRELAASRCGASARETLSEMRSEYRRILNA